MYRDVPQAGDYCLELTILDGGIHDGDGRVNGVIEDPGYMLLPSGGLVVPDFTVRHRYRYPYLASSHLVTFDVCRYLASCSGLTIDSLSSGGAVLASSVSGTSVSVEVPSWVTAPVNLNLTYRSGGDVTAGRVTLILEADRAQVQVQVQGLRIR